MPLTTLQPVIIPCSPNLNTKVLGNLQLAMGDTLPVSHFDTSLLPSYRPLALKHLLLVPSVTKNLISISKLNSDNDFIFEFNSSSCCVKDKFSKEILLTGTLRNGLYHQDLSSPSLSSPPSSTTTDRHFYLVASAACAETSPVCSLCNKTQSVMSLWHNRLGHPNSNVLHQVIKQLHVAVPLKTIPRFYEACQFGK